jgi:YHS domain-containing protein
VGPERPKDCSLKRVRHGDQAKEAAMTATSSLADRIDAEFTASAEKIKQFQDEQLHEHHERQHRLERFDQLLDELREPWQARLETLAQRFRDRVQVTPDMAPGRRHATFQFQSELARIRLRFSATTDLEVTRVVFSYDLEILPMLMQFNSHAELEFPLEAVDRGALIQWVDDRIVSFVHTYLSLNENELYLKKQMVEDPVIHVRFPKYAAGAKLEWQGKTYYFVGEETRREFEQVQGILAGAP